MKESEFQRDLIKDIKNKFKGCIVIKNDPSYIQGIPDILVLHNDKWAALECKRNRKSNRQPNQKYYVEKMGKMGYASFISPENKEEVLDEVQQSFLSSGTTRLP